MYEVYENWASHQGMSFFDAMSSSSGHVFAGIRQVRFPFVLQCSIP
jgi:mannitol-specific phosphotransferase system IIBC component